MLGFAEEDFIEIISGLLCLGYKNESAINSSFVDSIKGVCSWWKNSKIYIFIFFKRYWLSKYWSRVLFQFEFTLESYLSSVSTNFENNEEESKYDNNNNKSEEESLSTRNNQESSPKSQNFPSITQNSLLSSPSEIKNSPKSNEKASLIVEGINAEINDESNKNSKKITIQNDQQTKKNESIQAKSIRTKAWNPRK